ncbi:hypothetical protein PHJA_001144200 [Phtheirospermum japonicum]|uniref:Nucleolus and neural progenitor protein-like N-terminal domain-containing protein n=1 Tax=Phtheirospermum japonicum TaxID=374723 RepID=A0A830C0V7_9LAMI|nr:hypothetical protein PHJA_001144200 [Phtheirospermum japonicum]
METIEQRLKSFTGQLQTECAILERLVYKHKNQHRRCSYFQYILKVRRDLKLLKSTNLEDILDSSFLVVNGNRPKQKVQLLENLKRRKCGAGKYNFLERLLGVTRLLSEMIEPLLKAAMEISTLLARSFFMKFSLTTLAVLARIRVLVQQMLVDAVLLYNTVSSVSQKEQMVKLNQEGFEVFREYYPTKEEDSIMLECVWQTDKYVLVEREHKNEANSQVNDVSGDVTLSSSKVMYENIEVLLGVDESGTAVVEHGPTDPINAKENDDNSEMNKDEKLVQNASDTATHSTTNIVASEDVLTNTDDKKPIEDGSSKSSPVKRKIETKKKVAFVSIKPPARSTTNVSRSFDLKGTEKNGADKEDDPFFDLLTGSNKKSRLL